VRSRCTAPGTSRAVRRDRHACRYPSRPAPPPPHSSGLDCTRRTNLLCRLHELPAGCRRPIAVRGPRIGSSRCHRRRRLESAGLPTAIVYVDDTTTALDVSHAGSALGPSLTPSGSCQDVGRPIPHDHPHPQVKVWAALTTLEDLAAWFGSSAKGKVASGQDVRRRGSSATTGARPLSSRWSTRCRRSPYLGHPGAPAGLCRCPWPSSWVWPNPAGARLLLIPQD
jgi:hypothetical protein